MCLQIFENAQYMVRIMCISLKVLPKNFRIFFDDEKRVFKKLMQNFVLYIIFFGTLLTIQYSFACMPHSPQDVFIARFQDAKSLHNKPLNFKIQLREEQFIFRSMLDRLQYAKPVQWYSTFSVRNIAQNQLIIGLAYAPDGRKPEQYQIVSLATLNCENDQLVISDPIVSFLAWNKKTSNCVIGDRTRVGILDGFIQYDQTYYLKKLQQKYPSCQQLNAAFPKTVVTDSAQNTQQLSGLERWYNKLFNGLKAWF